MGEENLLENKEYKKIKNEDFIITHCIEALIWFSLFLILLISIEMKTTVNISSFLLGWTSSSSTEINVPKRKQMCSHQLQKNI